MYLESIILKMPYRETASLHSCCPEISVLKKEKSENQNLNRDK